MEPPTAPPMPAEYYREHAVRVRRMAAEATIAAITEYLLDVAQQYDGLAIPPSEPGSGR